VKATAKTEIVAKSVKYFPAKRVPAKHVHTVNVFSTIDVLIDNLRRNHIGNIAYPWDKVSPEPAIFVRKQP